MEYEQILFYSFIWKDRETFFLFFYPFKKLNPERWTEILIQ